jgi:hypothetical protein
LPRTIWPTWVLLGLAALATPGTARADEPAIDLPVMIVTPTLEIGWASVGGELGRAAMGVNLQAGRLNVFVEPRISGAFERVKPPGMNRAAPGDTAVVDGFAGIVVRERSGTTAIGLVSISSDTSWHWSKPREITETRTTTHVSGGSYQDIETLDQYIVEAGVLSDLVGTSPDLGRVVFPAAGLRVHSHFDLEGEHHGKRKRVRRQVVLTAHVVGAAMRRDDVLDPDRATAGGSFGFMATADMHVLRVANAVFRVGSLPEHAGFQLGIGLKFPYWL